MVTSRILSNLKINGKERIKLKSGSIKFNNHFEQLGVLFKIYAEFESVLKGVRRDDRGSNAPYTIIYAKTYSLQFY